MGLSLSSMYICEWNSWTLNTITINNLSIYSYNKVYLEDQVFHMELLPNKYILYDKLPHQMSNKPKTILQGHSIPLKT